MTPSYSDEFAGFRQFKCVKCKTVFKVNSGVSAFCPVCDKEKMRVERYIGVV